MRACVALLRAVNVGGSSPFEMMALRTILSRAGFTDVQTVLQSGNVVFQSGLGTTGELERRLEAELSKGAGLETQVFVRTAAEWRSILRGNPFPVEAEKDPSHLVVTFLRDAPSASGWAALARSVRGRERLTGSGREAYFVYPDGIGRSKLTASLIESRLQTRGTSRNWNTVRKLDRLLSGLHE